jgi:hypothetical protein
MLEYAYTFAVNKDSTIMGFSVGRGGYMSRVSIFSSKDNWDTFKVMASLDIED